MLGATGGIQSGGNVGRTASNIKAETIATKMENAMELLNNLTDELRGETHTLTSKDVGKKQESQASTKETGGKELSGQGTAAAEGALQAMTDDEAMKLKKKKRKMEFEKKMDALLELEADLQEVEFEDQEHQELLEQFFQNMSTIKNRKEELNRLELQEERLEEQLKREEKEKTEKEQRKKKSSLKGEAGEKTNG